MAKLIPIKIPLLNPNEPEALLSSLVFKEGEKIHQGDVIAVIETTKSTGEIQADEEGFLVGLRFKQGDSLHAGETLAYIGNSPDARDAALPPWSPEQRDQQESTSASHGLRITNSARDLALKAGLDLDTLPKGPLMTLAKIQERIEQAPVIDRGTIPADENRLVIYGIGGHGRSLAALINALGAYHIIGFLDDGYPPGKEILGMTVLGGAEKLPELVNKGIRLAINGVGGIGDLSARLSVYNHLHTAGFHCPKVIHPTAFLEESAQLADGVQVFPLAYVGTHVQVDYGCIINTGAIVSHDCVLARYVNLSPGATLAGGVTVGKESLIGMGATLNLGVNIGQRARIGNGATVKADVPDGGVVPAGTIWPLRQ